MLTTRIETSLGFIEVLDETNEPDYNIRLITAAPELLDVLEELLADNLLLRPSVRNSAICERAQLIIDKARGDSAGAVETATEDDGEQAIIVIGNPFDGMRCCGPYPSAIAASEAAEDIKDSDFWVVSLGGLDD